MKASSLGESCDIIVHSPTSVAPAAREKAWIRSMASVLGADCAVDASSNPAGYRFEQAESARGSGSPLAKQGTRPHEAERLAVLGRTTGARKLPSLPADDRARDILPIVCGSYSLLPTRRYVELARPGGRRCRRYDVVRVMPTHVRAKASATAPIIGASGPSSASARRTRRREAGYAY